MDIFKFLGIASAVVFLAGDTPYFIRALKKQIKPQRVTWGVFAVVNATGFANQYASGARDSVWIFAAAVLANIAIFCASLRHGVGGYGKTDLFALLTSSIGIILWQAYDSPLLSIAANVVVAIAALIPTVIKTKADPESEDISAWFFGAISAFMAAVSVGSFNFQLLILPLVGCVVQIYMVYLIRFRPKRL